MLSHPHWQCERHVRPRPYAASSNRRYGRHYDVTASMSLHGYAGGKISACCLVFCITSHHVMMALNMLRYSAKIGKIWGLLPLISLRGHLDKIGVAAFTFGVTKATSGWEVSRLTDVGESAIAENRNIRKTVVAEAKRATVTKLIGNCKPRNGLESRTDKCIQGCV